MVGIGLGAAAFAALFAVDCVSLKLSWLSRKVFETFACGLFGLAVLLTIQGSPSLTLPAALRVTGCFLTGISGLLLAYSLFIEIPLRSAWTGFGSAARFVRTGTHALCRHPGVLWLGGLIEGLFLASGALLLAPAFVVWMSLALLTVWLQERLFLIVRFGEAYRDYQRDVPMVVPTLDSILGCAHSLRRG